MVIGNKRAQFFLLAAVIIVAVVISLGVNPNRATVNREPESFYDFSYEVQRETGAVIDYEIYTFDDPEVEGGDGDVEVPDGDVEVPDSVLDEFVNLLADDIRDKNPDANFMFVYGNNEEIELKNYGSEDAYFGGETVEGSGKTVYSAICIDSSCYKDVENLIGDFNDNTKSGYMKVKAKVTDEGVVPIESISVKVRGYDFDFPISKHRQVIFIMQKDVNDESFITAE